MSTMKLTYFDARGRAEMTRMLFKLAGKDFEDNRVTGESWQNFKKIAPKGQVPVLEYDGKMICESNAIARFVARETGLYGSNNFEAAVCDMIADTVGDAVTGVAGKKFMAKTDEARADYQKKIDSAVAGLETLVKTHKKGKFVLGDKASYADVMLCTAMDFIRMGDPDFKCDSCPTVAAVVKDFEAIPAIAEWIKTRPESTF